MEKIPAEVHACIMIDSDFAMLNIDQSMCINLSRKIANVVAGAALVAGGPGQSSRRSGQKFHEAELFAKQMVGPFGSLVRWRTRRLCAVLALAETQLVCWIGDARGRSELGPLQQGGSIFEGDEAVTHGQACGLDSAFKDFEGDEAVTHVQGCGVDSAFNDEVAVCLQIQPQGFFSDGDHLFGSFMVLASPLLIQILLDIQKFNLA